MMYYILNEQMEPEGVSDSLVWAHWYEANAKKYAKVTEVGKLKVSTVFLGIDHSFGGPIPVLWETMIFGEKDKDRPCYRYSTRQEAVVHHEKIVWSMFGICKGEEIKTIRKLRVEV